MKFDKLFMSYTEDLATALRMLDIEMLEQLCWKIAAAGESGHAIYLFGNGGSSATPSHSAGDWAKTLGIRSFCLTDNTPFVTAISNDEAYEDVFRSQLKVYLKPGDLVIAYSGSGNSPNVVNAVTYVKERGNYTVGITGDYQGKGGGKLAQLADLVILTPSKSMEIIEDTHLVINHIIKEYIKAQRLNNPDTR